MERPLFIDQREYPASPDRNLLEHCLALGFDLPYFCWHPALGSVGACRQCAVKQFKDEHDRKGRLVMACMTPATAGTRISIDDPEAREFRALVIEWLMTNHPHDCPVCDEGGECHLQDMTVMTGHTYRRYRSLKRTFRNQYLGPFVQHEMNRCITCYRCVRFYRDYAGGLDLQALASKNHVYFGREQEGVLENPFSGNLAEVCPTGVFTDRTSWRHYTRKWDLQSAPSLCVHCAVGCNTQVAERYGSVRRILNRYHHDINGYFLCDRGRFGYGFVNSERRIRAACVREPGQVRTAVPSAALAAAARLVGDRTQVIGIGSPRASLESNFALRELVGAESFFSGMSDAEARICAEIAHLLRELPLCAPTLRDVEQCDAALVLGEDVLATAPRLSLAVRQCVRNAAVEAAQRVGVPRWDDGGIRAAAQKVLSPLYIAASHSTGLDDIASGTWHGCPDELARFGFAVARALDGSAPAPDDLPDEGRWLAGKVAEALRKARRPLIVSGAGCRSEAVVHAAANVALALHRQGKEVALSLNVPECDSLGLALLQGAPLSEAFARVREKRARVVIILENDLFRRAAPAAVQELLDTAQVIVIDHVAHAASQGAAVLLPAATFAEASGTLVNSEGRAQRFFRVLPPDDNVRDSWRWIGQIVAACSPHGNPWPTLDQVTRACARAQPSLASIVTAAPPAAFRSHGQKIPRQPQRYSGRTAVLADRTVHEPKPPEDIDSALAFSMEGEPGEPPPALVTHFWAPRWNSYQAVNKFRGELPGSPRGGPPGVRLLNPHEGDAGPYFSDIPAHFQPRSDALLLVPRHLVFGSEELSMLAPPVAERAGRAALLLNPADGIRLGLGIGAQAEVRTDAGTRRMHVQLDAHVAPGTAALPVGSPETPWLDLPRWGELKALGAGSEAP